MNVLDLFSGIGGFSLGLERAGMHTVAFCEIEEYPRKVLAKHWPGVPIHRDIKELDGTQYRGTVDVVCGGFPCQPFSQAGKRRGSEDDRALWPEMLRVIREVQPNWVIGENVIGLETMGLEHCVSDLESNGFAVQVFDIPACGVGAIHRRHRLWIVAHAERNERRRDGPGRGSIRGDAEFARDGEQGAVANPHHGRCKRASADSRQPDTRADRGDEFAGGCGWPTEPPVCRADDGISAELDFIGRVKDEFSNNQKTDAEIDAATGEILRTMWQHREIAETSPNTYRQRLRDCVPEMSRSDTCRGWLVGARAEKDKGLCDLWEAFCAAPQQEAQDLQQSLLERIGAQKRPKALASRVDRLKGLGNAVVPQIPEIIGRAILEQG